MLDYFIKQIHVELFHKFRLKKLNFPRPGWMKNFQNVLIQKFVKILYIRKIQVLSVFIIVSFHLKWHAWKVLTYNIYLNALSVNVKLLCLSPKFCSTLEMHSFTGWVIYFHPFLQSLSLAKPLKTYCQPCMILLELLQLCGFWSREKMHCRSNFLSL